MTGLIRARRWAVTGSVLLLLAGACSVPDPVESGAGVDSPAPFGVAILDTVLPNPDQGSHAVQIVDLDAGRLLDLELTLGAVP